MPNWCENTVNLTGKKEDIDRLEKALTRRVCIKNSKGNSWWANLTEADEEGSEKFLDGKECSDKFLFARALDYEDLGCDTPRNEFGYFDAIGHMGTKWDPEFHLTRTWQDQGGEHASVELFFDSAWSPPLRAMVILGKKYNLDIDHVYCEGGCDFGGRLRYFEEDSTVYNGQTTYLNWQYLWCEDSYDTVEDLIAWEFGDGFDEEFKEGIRKDSESWAKTEDEFTNGPYTYEHFIQAELDWKDQLKPTVNESNA